jgi:hypothetical protein
MMDSKGDHLPSSSFGSDSIGLQATRVLSSNKMNKIG